MKILNLASVLPYKYRTMNSIVIKLSEEVNILSKGEISFRYATFYPWSNFLLSLIKKKWEEYYKSPEYYYYNYDSRNIKIIGLKGISLPKDYFTEVLSSTYFLMNYKKLKKIIFKSKIKVLHAHYLFPDGLVALFLSYKFKIPFILSVRSPDRKYLDRNFISKILTNKILTRASKIITFNLGMKEKILNFNNNISNKISIIPHPIKKNELYKNFKVNKKIKIITISHYQKYKRLPLIIKSLSILNKLGYEDSYSYTLIGENKENLNLKKLAKKLNVDINFTGRLSYRETQDKLKCSDIFILTSYYETFGLSYIEAMAKSNATIAVKGTGIWGIFKDNEEVIYTEKGNIKSIISALKYFLDNPAEIRKYKKRSYNAVKQRLINSKIIPKYVNLYKTINT
ncbi:MAG: glycosyltransferase family 4 protein [archaeon]